MMRTIRKLSKFLKPYRRWAILAPLFMMLEVAMDLMQPRMVQRIIDVGIAQRDMTVVTSTGLFMIGLASDRGCGRCGVYHLFGEGFPGFRCGFAGHPLP